MSIFDTDLHIFNVKKTKNCFTADVEKSINQNESLCVADFTRVKYCPLNDSFIAQCLSKMT